MSSQPPFKQDPHKLLVIPGPIEVSDEVLYANAHPSMSHIAPDFIPVFGDCIRMIREVVYAPNAQPFLVSGSGTLGWDQVAVNLIEPGEKVLVLTTGYFGDSFADCLKVYGADVEQLVASPVGAATDQQALEDALTRGKYKAVAFTHVDTSTGVLNDAKMIGQVVKKLAPNTIVVADCVCSVASEELNQEEWCIDVVLTGSQKGIGCPPGLSILTVSPRAMKIFEDRSTPITSYYASWKRWLPIMKAYESGSPAYFATPPVNLIYALHTALEAITKQTPSIPDRLKRHQQASLRVKQACESLGLKQVPIESKVAANGMSAMYVPSGISAADIISRMSAKGVIVAGGLHKDIKPKYFRIGHMGVSAVDDTRDDLNKIISALKEAVNDSEDR